MISSDSKAKSSVKSMSVTAFVGNLLLPRFSKVKPKSSYFPSVALLIACSRKIAKRYGAKVSHWSTPALMSNRAVSPSGDTTLALVPS